MPRHYRKTFLGLGTLVLAGAFTASAIPAFASSFPVTDARIVAHFDFTAGQQPENITLEPNGDADVTFAYAHQVARVTPQGKITILATLPAATSGTTAASGIVRTSDGTLYVNYLDIGGTQSGIWRINRNGSAEQVVGPARRGVPQRPRARPRHRGAIHRRLLQLARCGRCGRAPGRPRSGPAARTSSPQHPAASA